MRLRNGLWVSVNFMKFRLKSSSIVNLTNTRKIAMFGAGRALRDELQTLEGGGTTSTASSQNLINKLKNPRHAQNH